ncbi:serine/threonine protein kinase, partial [bacterium]
MNELDPFGIIGRTLDGQYRVEAFVGEGSFSAVYRGMQDGLGESCAIKCLKLPGGMEPALIETFVRRFRDESKLHYRLAQGNLNIARSLAAGSFAVEATGQVVPYIVFEWLEGRTLAQEIQVRREVGDGPMVIEEAVRILRTAADALAFAHSQGVVHRDVTPSNLFLLRAAHPPRTKVLDFGLAKVVSDHAMDLGPRAPTMGYLKLFSPGYAAPEQFDQRYGAIGPWTDVYAFAQVLVELLYGRSLCDGDNLAAYAAVAMNRDRRPTPRAFGLE